MSTEPKEAQQAGESCADRPQGHDHGDGECGADALRAQIEAQIAAEAAAGGVPEHTEACPMPSEATDFLHWPWVWRFGQFFFVLALGWQFWPAAANLCRVFLYLATAATMAGSWVQMAKSSGGAPVQGSWLARWRLAVQGWPEKFSGPLWILTALAIGMGFWIAGRNLDDATAGLSRNAFVEKADMLLIGLVGFVQFRFTVARRQPFWLMGLIAESWLVGLSALCAVLVGAYALRSGWPRAPGPDAENVAPLSGWNSGYGTAFAHLAVVGCLLGVARSVGDPLWWTSRADQVTAARIKASRMILLGGNLAFAVVSVLKWRGADVRLEAIGWPDLEHLRRWTSTVYVESFGSLPAGAVIGALVGCLGVFAWLTWRALGQRVTQMPATSKQPVAEVAAGAAATEQTPGWQGWGWMAGPLAACGLALAATQKKVAWAAAGAGVLALIWLAKRARAAMGPAGPAPATHVIQAAPVTPAGNGSNRLNAVAVLGGLFALAAVGLMAVPTGALSVSREYRRVWWTLAWERIEAQPGGHGFGAHIFRADFKRVYEDSPEGAARLQAAIPEALRPKMEPGWGARDLAFHEKWLTWELSKGFDTHSAVLQALFEGGWGWLAILAAAGLTALFLRGGLRRGPAPGPSVLLDGLVLALMLLCAVDVASGSLEKMAACIMAAWVAWAPPEPSRQAASESERA
ncbi:MAG TPA: hypothetical protein VL860_09100 [Planctomycetota bacterium]|nr:hypothetical protein [Planctomycetota bacterium]